MAWYSYKVTDLNYSKPIIVIDENKNTYLLMPTIETGDYRIVGYNWFNITLGKWDSCTTWKTPQKAVEAYKNDCKICNNEITFE